MYWLCVNILITCNKILLRSSTIADRFFGLLQFAQSYCYSMLLESHPPFQIFISSFSLFCVLSHGEFRMIVVAFSRSSTIPVSPPGLLHCCIVTVFGHIRHPSTKLMRPIAKVKQVVVHHGWSLILAHHHCCIVTVFDHIRQAFKIGALWFGVITLICDIKDFCSSRGC